LREEKRAEQLVRERDQANATRAPREIKGALADLGRMRTVAQHFAQSQRGDIPLELILGWIHQESSGRLDLEMHNKKDEIGWFQISREERNEILHLSESARHRILEDPTFSALQGIQLIRNYDRYLKHHFSFRDDSPSRWGLIRLLHHKGMGAVHKVLKRMRDNHLDPSKASWAEVKQFLAGHSQANLTLESLSTVENALVRGRALLAAMTEE
jgi:hypothetical protein